TLDQMKGVGIILMLIGHLFIPYIGRFIFSFHMPLFFLVSGYLYKKKPNLQMFWTLFKRLMVPYIVLGFLFLIYSEPPLEALMSLLAAECWKMRPCVIETQAIAGVFWFLPAMFFAKLIYNFIADTKYVHIIVLVLFTSFWIVGKHTHLPLCISEGCTAMIFVHLGYMFRQYEAKVDSVQKYIYWIGTPVTIVCLIFSYTEVGTSSYKFYLLDVAVACFINYLLYKILCSNKSGYIAKALNETGLYSLQLLCVHVFVGVLLAQFGFADPHEIRYATLSLILPFVIVFGVKGTPLNLIFKL
ncbi:MAG: acyltransferase family protein, partial [bacterium]|nr:acyltransferase family protein [Candidatus Minthenecus merdequi]